MFNQQNKTVFLSKSESKGLLEEFVLDSAFLVAIVTKVKKKFNIEDSYSLDMFVRMFLHHVS